MLTIAERSALRKKLRRCQRDAIAAAEAYLASNYDGKASLLCLPTGAGKTGIIAMVSQSRASGTTLVLSPRVAVCEQLKIEIGGRFFEQRGLRPKRLCAVSNLDDAEYPDAVVVETFQKFAVMSEEDRNKALAPFDLVIVDEGHSEPAPIWGRIVRSMKCRKIIMTATPYRNDLFQFDIGKSNYAYTFKQALGDSIVVEPSFLEITPSRVVKEVVSWLRKNPNLKCIVKCEEFSDVARYLHAFKATKFGVAAFHERFALQPEPGGFVSVPTGLDASDQRIFVHQHKLDEGVDLPSAKLLVLSYPVGNGRELVQSLGRIVRTHGASKPLVLDCFPKNNQQLWKNYREFDSYISSAAGWGQFERSLDSATLIEAYLDAFPKLSYFEENFRETFRFDDFDPDKHLELPLVSFCFIQKNKKFAVAAFMDTLAANLRAKGELVKVYRSAFGPHVLLSVTFKNSRFLSKQIFFEPRIEVVVVQEAGNAIGIYDSRDVTHSARGRLGSGAPLSVERLLNLASLDKRRRTKEARSIAISTALKRPNAVSLQGADLNQILPSQSNQSYALSMAKVDNINDSGERTSSYYLGIGSGRVADQKNRDLSLEEVATWVGRIDKVLSAPRTAPEGILKSYSMPVAGGIVGTPLSAAIDVDEVADVRIRWKRRVISISPGFHYCPIKNGKLKLEQIPLSIGYDSTTGKMAFSSGDELVIQSDVRNAGDDVMEWINSLPLTVLFDKGQSYSNGKFYSVQLPTQSGFDLDQSYFAKEIRAIPELTAQGMTEKGATFGPTNFDPDSLFGLIDSFSKPLPAGSSRELQEMAGELAGCDLILCNDMGTEACDFVFSSPNKLVYVHAKCGTTIHPKSSAGALSVVGCQAVKNIEYLISKDETLSLGGNEATLDQPWSHSHGVGQVSRRLRVFRPDGQDMFLTGIAYAQLVTDALRTIKARRASDACQKAIWLVIANSFSRSHFVKQLKKGSSANAESLQAYQLLTSWISTASANDIDLKAFIST